MSRPLVLITALGLIIVPLVCPTQADAAVPASNPSVAARFSGAPEVVFNTRTDACERIDIPDAQPRAFRDDHNRVHLISTHFVARAMVGPTLDTVKRDCRVLYRSPEDPAPEHFEDRNWLASFFSVDGRQVVALAHSEYEGATIPGRCPAGRTVRLKPANCWWNTITFAQSTDGGFSFTSPPPPHNLVASLPYRYDPANHPGPAGYQQPTNILHVGQYYYAMLNAWPYREQKYGPCLIRTTDLFSPASWRAWDGSDFTIQFVNPYLAQDIVPKQHVCTPVIPGVIESLVVDSATGVYLAIDFTSDGRYGPPGIYLNASPDLIHWSRWTLVANTADMLRREGPGRWSYGYFAILDPASPDRNFETTSDTPFIYYVRHDLLHTPFTRDLMRRQIKLRVTL